MPQSKIRSLQLNSSDFREIVEIALGAPLDLSIPLAAGKALTLSGSPVQWTPVSGGGTGVSGGDGITVTGGSPVTNPQVVAVDSTVARTDITTETFGFAGDVSLNLNDTSQAADEDIWRVGATGSNFIIATRTDADGAGINAISITRTGTAVDDITMPSPLLLTSAGTASTSTALQVGSTDPAMVVNKTNATANQGVWDVSGGTDGQLIWRTRTDAFGTGATWLTVNRSGTTVGDIAFTGSRLLFNGVPVQVGSPEVGGGATTLNSLTDVSAGSPTIGAILYSDGTNWVKLPRGTNNQVLTMGSPLLPTWKAGGGGGSPIGAKISGTAAANQVAVFRNATDIEGDANFTFDATTLANAAGPIHAQSGGSTDLGFAFTTSTNTGLSLPTPGVLGLVANGTYIFAVQNDQINYTGSNGPVIRGETATATNPVFEPSSADSDTGIGWNAADQLSLIAGGVEMARLTEDAGGAGNKIDLNSDTDITGTLALFGSPVTNTASLQLGGGQQGPENFLIRPPDNGPLWVTRRFGSPVFGGNIHTSTTNPAMRIGHGSPTSTDWVATLAVVDTYSPGIVLRNSSNAVEWAAYCGTNLQMKWETDNFVTISTDAPLSAGVNKTIISILPNDIDTGAKGPQIQFQQSTLADISYDTHTQTASTGTLGVASSNAVIVWLTPTAANVDVQGVSASTTQDLGRVQTFVNITAGTGSPNNTDTITFKHENTSATASNRILLPGKGDVVLRAHDYIELAYNTNIQRWFCIGTTGVQQSGSPIT